MNVRGKLKREIQLLLNVCPQPAQFQCLIEFIMNVNSKKIEIK